MLPSYLQPSTSSRDPGRSKGGAHLRCTACRLVVCAEREVVERMHAAVWPTAAYSARRDVDSMENAWVSMDLCKTSSGGSHGPRHKEAKFLKLLHLLQWSDHQSHLQNFAVLSARKLWRIRSSLSQQVRQLGH